MRQHVTHETHFVQSEKKYRLREARLSYKVLRASVLLTDGPKSELAFRSGLILLISATYHKLCCAWLFSGIRLRHLRLKLRPSNVRYVGTDESITNRCIVEHPSHEQRNPHSPVSTNCG